MIRTFLQAAVLIALTAVAGVLTYFFHPNRPALYLTNEPAFEGEITLDEARAKEKSPGVLWIDARERPSFEKDHVPGALLLNESEYPNLILEVAKAIQEHQDRVIVVYCDAQKCAASRKIAEELRGIVPDPGQVFVLHGGFPAWQTGSGK